MKVADASTAATSRSQKLAMLDRLSRHAIGLAAEFELATGKLGRRIYLDSTASTLRLDAVQAVLDRYQPYYSNTHSTVHFGATLSTDAYHWAHEMALRFVRADPDTYTAFFLGSGATAGINRVAQTLSAKRPERDVVITSIMEHHSNDLPHRKHFRQVVHVPAQSGPNSMGAVDVAAIEAALKAHGDKVNYVAVTGVSNVTGIINPIHEIAALAHRYGALIVVDGAQMVAHVPCRMHGHADPERDLDVLVFSGHKIYAPGSPGVVVARKVLFEDHVPVEVGGGMVDEVWIDRYQPTARLPDREEAGTPNICGAIGLAAALYALDRIGMDLIFHEECELIHYALDKLRAIDGVVIYGETDVSRCQRAGAISFNIHGVHHALTAAVLNDYFGIAVRNECFCAHPYVREMITEALSKEDEQLSIEALEALAEMQRGMVRASFGVYSTRQDIDALAAAITDISARRGVYAGQYKELDNGAFEHKSFRFEPKRLFSIADTVDAWLQEP